MVLALAAAPISLAQTSYEQIQVGAVLRGDIGLGTFQKPLPLPEGEWLVVGNKTEAQPLTQGVLELSTPKVTLALKSSASDNPISSLVVTFVPFPSRVSWQNGKCENTNPAVFVDDFGTTTTSMTYLCVQARAVSRFKSVVAAARTSLNAWVKDNLSDLSPYAQEFPDEILWVSVYGSRDLGRSVSYTFFMKREYDILSNARYATFVKEWMNSAGKALGEFLQDREASLRGLPKFSAETSQPTVAAESTPAASTAPLGPVMAPVWQVGDEWQYSYRGPSDSGTYVWSVNRIESLDGIPHYVIKSGTREILYRVSDLAFSLERVDGVVVTRERPSRLSYFWPLTAGKLWEQSAVREAPVDRQTISHDSLYTVDAEETITVPAGTFRTLKIVRRNKHTSALITEYWYAPDVKQSVKIREVLSNGVRERELLAFKVKQTPAVAPPTEANVLVPSTASVLPPAKPTMRRGITKVSGSDPAFPRAAIRAGIEKGLVVARMQIDETGNVYGVTIVKADPPGHFDQAVVDALSGWKFLGEGTKYVGEVEVKFELKDGPARSSGDLSNTIAALVKKYEAAQTVAPVADAERVALAREIIEATGTRVRLSQTLSTETFKERMGVAPTDSKVPPKLREAIEVTAVASFRADRIVASLERRLSGMLDAATLRAGLEWERSNFGRTINRLELEVVKPELQAAKKEFVEQFVKSGAVANDARARACAQKDILDNSAEAMLPILEAMAGSGMMASAEPGQSLDLDAIQRLIAAIRPVLRDTVRQAVLADCLFTLRHLSDAEFDKWLEFLRTDLGGRYARGRNSALRDALLELAEVFTRTLVDVVRQQKGSGET
jgi:TonB family protein